MQSDADEEVVAIFKPLHLYINLFCISREGGFYFYEIYIEPFFISFAKFVRKRCQNTLYTWIEKEIFVHVSQMIICYWNCLFYDSFPFWDIHSEIFILRYPFRDIHFEIFILRYPFRDIHSEISIQYTHSKVQLQLVINAIYMYHTYANCVFSSILSNRITCSDE